MHRVNIYVNMGLQITNMEQLSYFTRNMLFFFYSPITFMKRKIMKLIKFLKFTGEVTDYPNMNYEVNKRFFGIAAPKCACYHSKNSLFAF
jgi:hypothetical protein